MPIPNEHMLDHCVLGADDQPSSRLYIMMKEEAEAFLVNSREVKDVEEGVYLQDNKEQSGC